MHGKTVLEDQEGTPACPGALPSSPHAFRLDSMHASLASRAWLRHFIWPVDQSVSPHACKLLIVARAVSGLAFETVSSRGPVDHQFSLPLAATSPCLDDANFSSCSATTFWCMSWHQTVYASTRASDVVYTRRAKHACATTASGKNSLSCLHSRVPVWISLS